MKHVKLILCLLFLFLLLLGCADPEPMPPTSIPEAISGEPDSATLKAIDSTSDSSQFDESLVLNRAFYADYLLSVAGENGVYVHRLTDRPYSQVATSMLPVTAWDVVVRRDTAYLLSCNRDCIRRIDLSDPEKPNLSDWVYFTNKLEPVDMMLASADDLLYLSIQGDAIQIISNNLQLVAELPFQEPVADMAEVFFRANGDEMKRYVNIAVEGNGIHGVHVPLDHPAQAALIGFQVAPKPAWHLPDNGTISALAVVRNTLLGTAGKRGIREYLSWGEADTAANKLREGSFKYVKGDALDITSVDTKLAVLSEDESSRYISIFHIEHTEGETTGWNSDQTLVDVFEAPSRELSDIQWHNGVLWGTQPELVKLVDQETVAQLIAEQAELDEAQVADPLGPSTQRLRYVGRIGATPEIVGRSGNILYAKLDNELFVYDVTDENNPKLVNQILFPDTLGPMPIGGGVAYLIQYGFETAYAEVLDIVDPIHPKSIGQVPGILQIHTFGDFQVAQTGYVRTFVNMLERNLETGELEAAQSLNDLVHELVELQIVKDTNGTFAVNSEIHGSYASSFRAKDNILVLDWRMMGECPAVSIPDEHKFTRDDGGPCFMGYVVLDMADVTNPQVVSSNLYDEYFRFGEIDQNNMLTLQFDSGESKLVDLSELITTSDENLGLNVLLPQDALTDYSMTDLAILDSFAYVLDAKNKERITVFEISDEVTFEQKFEWDISDAIIQIEAHKNLLVAQSADQLYIYDTTDRLAPTLLKSIPNGTVDHMPQIGFSDDWLVYGAGQDYVLEKFEAGEWLTVSIQFPGIVTSLPVIDGNFVYAIADRDVLLTLDFEDPQNIQITDSIDELEVAPFSVLFLNLAIVDQVLFLGCEFAGICIFDIGETPHTPAFREATGGRCLNLYPVEDGVLIGCDVFHKGTQLGYMSVEHSDLIKQQSLGHPQLWGADLQVAEFNNHLFIPGNGLLHFKFEMLDPID